MTKNVINRKILEYDEDISFDMEPNKEYECTFHIKNGKLIGIEVYPK